MAQPVTKALIPTSGIHITETYYPAGFTVARYDAEGFTSDNRWFQTLPRAQAYAAMLKA